MLTFADKAIQKNVSILCFLDNVDAGFRPTHSNPPLELIFDNESCRLIFRNCVKN